MKIIEIIVDDKSFARMEKGPRVEGTVGYDLQKGIGDLNAIKRKRDGYPKDKLVRKLPWGWVKKSLTRTKVFGSFPDELGTARVLGLMEDHHRDAKNAIIEREIIDRV